MCSANIPWEMKTFDGRVNDTLGREAGKVSPLHERMGMERVVGMNSWLAEYDVSVDI